jgi:TrmH RNA methyltransferase
VLACYEKRPNALKRLYFAPELIGELGDLCHWMATEKRSYNRCTPNELARAAGHKFHDGVAAYTERPLPGTPKPSDYETWSTTGEPILFIEDVADPLQIGAIARTAVANGLKRLIFSGAKTIEAAYRGRAWTTAAGALDNLVLHDAALPLPILLRDLHTRFCITGFTRPGGRRVDDLKPIRAPGRPLAIVIGGAATGITAVTGGKCEHLLHIPGAGGSALYNAADTAAYGLPWLLRRERHPAPGQGFLAKKRARQTAETPEQPTAPTA